MDDIGVVDTCAVDAVALRPLGRVDAFLLRTATVLNVNWCGERLTFRDIEVEPGLRHYCELRPERGDFGWVAEVEGQAVGVVWCLVLPADDPGYGFIADGIPELSLCVLPGYRGRGTGSRLMDAALRTGAERGVARVSLSVEDPNPSERLYRRHGFEFVPTAAPGTMAVTLPLRDISGLG